MSEEKTPGQAAFEVAQERMLPKNRLDWRKVHQVTRDHFEAEAQAAIDQWNDNRDELNNSDLAEITTARMQEALTALQAERDSLQRSCQLLAGVLVSQARTLYCAWIEASRDDLPAMREWVLNGMPDADDNDPADQWNGTETADEWFERTQDDGDAPKPQAQAVSSLRALLDKAASLLWDTGMPGNRQAAGELRASGGLEALT